MHTYTGGRTLTECAIDHHVLVPANSLPEAEEEEDVTTRQGQRRRHQTKDLKRSADPRQGNKMHFLENILERAELAESRRKNSKNLLPTFEFSAQ